MKIVFPLASEIASELLSIDRSVEGDCDVRLQVYDDGSWAVRFGLPDYDQDHRGFWGASCVPGDSQLSEAEALDTARELIEQAAEHAAQCGEDPIVYEGKLRRVQFVVKLSKGEHAWEATCSKGSRSATTPADAIAECFRAVAPSIAGDVLPEIKIDLVSPGFLVDCD